MPLDDEGAARTPLRVSNIREMRDARFLRSVESSHTNLDQIGELAASLGVHAASVGLDSQAKYAVLAGGHADVLLRLLSPKKPDYRECIWDQAAGSLVVQEAGGRVTDLDGWPLNFGRGKRLEANRGVCATNGALHEAILSALEAMSAAG
jgi:3'(2'), 5'-bisphosphate nucleotidase